MVYSCLCFVYTVRCELSLWPASLRLQATACYSVWSAYSTSAEPSSSTHKHHYYPTQMAQDRQINFVLAELQQRDTDKEIKFLNTGL